MLAWLLVLALVAAGGIAQAAPLGSPVDGESEGGRQYQGKDGQPHDIEEPAKQDRGKISTLLQVGKANTKEEEQLFERYFQYQIHAFTWKEKIGDFPTLRANLKKHLVQAGKPTVTDLHDELNRMTLKICGDAAADEGYPMAIRYNCLLMIGELDAKEATTTSRDVTPLPDARKLLLSVLADGKQPVALRLAAVIGLRRNVTAGGMPADDQNSLADSLMKIVGEAIDPQRENAGTLWLRLRAVDVLHQLSIKGRKIDQQAIIAVLSPLVADERIATWIRCQAAGELAGVEAQQFTPEQVAQDVRALANLVVAISASNAFTKFAQQAALEKEEADKAEAGKKSTKPKKPDADKPESDKGEKGDADKPADKEPALPLTKPMRDVAVHALLYQLGRIRLGLMGKEPAKRDDTQPSPTHGLCAAADAETKKIITTAIVHIDAMLTELSKLNDKKDVAKEDVAAAALSIENSGRDLEEELGDLLAAPENTQPNGEPTTPPSGEPGTQPSGKPAKAVAKPSGGRTGQPAGNVPAGESAVGAGP